MRYLRSRLAAVLDSPRLPVFVACGMVLAAALAPHDALARAGGGSHSGGSSSGGLSGGSSGGAGFGGSSLFFLPFLFSGGGAGIGGFLVLMAVLYGVSKLRGGGGSSNVATDYGSAAPLQYGPTGQPLAAEGLAAIKANDPGFEEEQFLARCNTAFMLLQKAWMDRNIDEGRAYMSSALYMTWKLQVESMIANHKKNILENLHTEGIHIVRASHDDNFDTISVRLDAAGSDYEVDDQTNKRVFGETGDNSFTEYWTFQRSAGAKTLVSGGITEQKCPNCGAPLQVNEGGDCKYCNAPVTSGKFDWVLSKIDQANEWS